MDKFTAHMNAHAAYNFSTMYFPQCSISLISNPYTVSLTVQTHKNLEDGHMIKNMLGDIVINQARITEFENRELEFCGVEITWSID